MSVDLWRAEAAFWTDSAADAARRLDEAAIMVFGPTGILQGEAIAASLQDAPRWDEVQMTERHMTETADLAILAYRARALRQGQVYEAVCSSTWLRRDAGWRLVSHQQTPL